MALSDRIRQRREDRRISAIELSRLAEMSKGYLSEIENGSATRPSGAVLFRIARALGTTVADLLEQDVAPETVKIPDALREFAISAELPPGDVDMLAGIKFRGEQPRTADDWRFLYESIKRSIVRGI